MQPELTHEFIASAEWDRLSEDAQGVLRGVLELAFRRDGAWSVEGTPKQMGEWFGRELGQPPARIQVVLRELEEAGYLCRGRGPLSSRFVVKAPVVSR